MLYLIVLLFFICLEWVLSTRKSYDRVSWWGGVIIGPSGLFSEAVWICLCDGLILCYVVPLASVLPLGSFLLQNMTRKILGSSGMPVCLADQMTCLWWGLFFYCQVGLYCLMTHSFGFILSHCWRLSGSLSQHLDLSFIIISNQVDLCHPATDALRFIFYNYWWPISFSSSYNLCTWIYFL